MTEDPAAGSPLPPTGLPPGPPSAPASSGAPPARPERPRWRTVGIMIGSGVLLAIGGCGTFLATMQDNGPLSVVGAVAFVGGALLLAIGGLTGIVFAVMALVRGSRPQG